MADPNELVRPLMSDWHTVNQSGKDRPHMVMVCFAFLVVFVGSPQCENHAAAAAAAQEITGETARCDELYAAVDCAYMGP